MEYITRLDLEAIVSMVELNEIIMFVKNEDGGIEVYTSKGKFEIISSDYAFDNQEKVVNTYKNLALIIK